MPGQPGGPQHRVEAPDRWGGFKWERSIELHIHCTPLYVLSHETRVFKDTMMQVADHLRSPSGVEDVIRTLPNSISDGMITMMENMDTVKNKVRVHVATRVQLTG